MYDLVFITPKPAFYKNNLYNEIKKHKKILVIFISKKCLKRPENFYSGNKHFEHIYLTEEFYEKRSVLKNSLKLLKILFDIKYKKIVIGGWDSLENWITWLLSSKKQISVVVESSEFESTNKGIKGLIKKIFISKVSLGFVSGESQLNLLRNIGYKGEIRKTKGVGIFNYKKINIEKNIKEVNKFLYVGRLSPEKNLEQIIRIFNNMPNLELNIVGYGPLEKRLKELAKSNINFLGKIDNRRLSEVYQKNDVFILPSKSEPWGLVVEEALYNGLPVILSDKVGCHAEIIENGKEGYIYNIESNKDLEIKIKKITNLNQYLKIKSNVQKLNFKKIKKEQIKAYY